ncbi:hypothetical protein ACTXKH_20110 [Brachybacterium tyrofermentans]|uniref:hypothetical protein n=1 Tax=Brachybacterium tyrofermentans TaxID=47848 RepID=UPI003FD2006E
MSGTAHNMFDHLGRFDLVLLLSMDKATLESRLADTSRENRFGRTPEEVAWSHAWREIVESRLTAVGAVSIDAGQAIEIVVDEVMNSCARAGLPVADRG